MGESPAGHLYVLVSFDENFTAQQDVIPYDALALLAMKLFV